MVTSFNILQNYGSSKAPVLYYVFDVLILGGRDVRGMPLSARRDMLERRILPKLGEPIRYSPESFKPALRISLLRCAPKGWKD